MRCFLAIEIPEPIRIELSRWSDTLRQSSVRATWVRPAHMHLTLRFFGDIQPNQVIQINERLISTLPDLPSFPLALRGLGAFPTLKRPNTIWAAVRSEDGMLNRVQIQCENAALATGFAPENRTFHPHVTLARIKDIRPPAEVIEILQAASDRLMGEFKATAVSLFESKLTPSGPIHTRLEEYRFT